MQKQDSDKESLSTEIKISLGSYITVFEAEIYAIYTKYLNCTWLPNLQKEWSNRTIYFHSDNRAAIRALVSSRITSKVVQKCNQVLNRLSRNNRTVVDWILEHSGVPGNERTDTLAWKADLMPREWFLRAVTGSYSLLNVE